MINEFKPIQKSELDIWVKLKAMVWKIVNETLFRFSPKWSNQYRVSLLRLFGARIDRSCNIHRLSNIEHPWNLEMGYLSSLGENTWIYCLDTVKIGVKSCIGKDVYLITGSHDINSLEFRLVLKPIIIGDGVWISTGACILPGVNLGDFSVVGAKSVVTKSTNKYAIVAGNPAVFIKNRNFNKD